MNSSDGDIPTSRDPAPLQAFARALLAASTTSSQPLQELLAAHPVASELLMDALLAGPSVAPVTEPLVESPPPPAARHIGPYRLDAELGRGGQAVVYVATDTRLGRRVALKVLHADVFQTAFREQRFRAEAATTSRLDHPGICPIYEVGQAGELLFLAMRLVDGRTLAAHIDAARQQAGERPFQLELANLSSTGERESGARHVRPWLPVLRLFESFAEALHAAHQAGITHRDVKPGNLMVQPDGRGVVLDFGLAADASRDGAALTRTGDVFGTPAYMAPEQCRGERTDHRVDIWALGASLFEALTGQRAFAAATPEATIRAILGGAVPNPCRLLRTLPFELGVVVGKALDPEPQRRYATAQEFGDDLRRIRELLPIVAAPPSVLLRARRFAQRNPWLVAMVVVLVVALAVGTGLVAAAKAKARENQVLFLRQDLEDLVAEFPLLQPVSEHRERAERWLQQGDALLGQRGLVEALRDQLRRGGDRGLEGGVGVEALAVQQELGRLAGIEAAVAAGRGVPDTVQYLRSEPQQRQRQARRDQLLAQAESLRTWRVENPTEQPLHDSCVKLLADLDQFAAEEGAYHSVQRELASLGSATVGWPEAIEAIRRAPAYGGLLLRPQRELQPLGWNAFGLYEFAHLRSGPAPQPRGDGSLGFAHDSGIVLVLLPGGRVTVGAQREEGTRRRFEPNLRGTEDYMVELDLEPFLLAKHETTRAQ